MTADELKQSVSDEIRENVAEARRVNAADMLREHRQHAQAALQALVAEWGHDQIYDWLGDCHDVDDDPRDEYKPGD